MKKLGSGASALLPNFSQFHYRCKIKELWDAQKPFCDYSSNGSKLIGLGDDKSHTVKRKVRYRDPDGYVLGYLSVGTKIIAETPKAGTSYYGYMKFEKIYKNGVWYDLNPNGTAGNKYAFVDLDLGNGSMPNNRAIW